jgi:hypothetical protein
LGAADDTWTPTLNLHKFPYYHENFAIRFVGDPDSGGGKFKNYWIDNVNLTFFKLSYPTYSEVSVNNTVSGRATRFSIT